MDYPVVDDAGELVEVRSASSVSALLAALPVGRHALVADVPSAPSWWDHASHSWVMKPAAPSVRHAWDSAAKSWVDRRELSEVQADAWADVKADRQQALTAAIDVDGMTFNADPQSATEIRLRALEAAVAVATGQQWSTSWILANNEVVTLDADQMSRIAAAVVARLDRVMLSAAARRALISAASSVVEVMRAVR